VGDFGFALGIFAVWMLSGSLDFDDPWGNHVQVVDYRDIQFTKTPGVLHAMGLDGLDKTEAAQREIRERGLAG